MGHDPSDGVVVVKLEFTRAHTSFIGAKLDAHVVVRMCVSRNMGSHKRFDAEFFSKLSSERHLRGLSWLDFTPGKFPKSGEGLPASPPRQKKGVSLVNDGGNDRDKLRRTRTQGWKQQRKPVKGFPSRAGAANEWSHCR